MLTLILGRAGSGKTSAVMEEIHRLGEQGKNSILIVPEQYSHDAERQLCRVCGDRASLYTEVVSFSRLCSRGSGLRHARVLDAGGRILLMNRAVRDISSKLRVLGALNGKARFLQELLAAYDELRVSCVDFTALYACAESIDGPFADKLHDLSLIFTVYEGLIPEGMTDPRGVLAELAQNVEKCGIDGTQKIYIDGFTDFTGQQAEVIRGIMKTGCDITVCLTCGKLDGDEPEFALPRKTAVQLLEMANRRGDAGEVVYRTGDGRDRAQELKFAEKFIMEHTFPQYHGENHAVEIYRAASPAEECELAASKVLEFIREYGFRYRDIAVTARNWSTYAALAENIFAKYEIPVMYVHKSDILQKPVLMLLLSALDVIIGDWAYADVFRYLKTDLTGLDRADRDELENYVLKWNIRGGSMWRRQEPWMMNPRGYAGELSESDTAALERINAARVGAAKPLTHLQEAMRSAATVQERAEALLAFAEEIDLAGALERKTAEYRSEGRNQAADEYAQLWEIFVKSLEQYVAVAGEECVNLEEFAELFRLLLSQYHVGTIPSSADSVGLGDMTRMKKRNIRGMILLGAGDENIPNLIGQGGMLSDDERETLTEFGIRLSDTPDGRMDREMNLIYTSLTLPSEKLTVSYSAVPDSASRPSFVAERLKTMFGCIEQEVDLRVKTAAKLPCFELAAAENSGDMLLHMAAEQYFKQNPDFRERLEAVQRAASMPRGRLSAASAKSLYGEKLRLTASRVDKFHSCRFAYFLQYGLRAKKRKPAGFDAPELGTFMHFVLEHVVDEVVHGCGFAELSPENCKKITRKYVNQYVEEVLGGFADKSERFVYLFRRLMRDVERVVQDTAEELAKSDFKPLDFELDFSECGDMEPYRMYTEDVDVAVSGKVDRVDGWLHDGKLYLRVVDYKTGKKAFSLSDIRYGLGLQMLIYLFVLEKSGKLRYGEEIVPAGVLYVPARNAVLSTAPGTDEDTVSFMRAKASTRSGLLLDDPEVIEAMEHGKKPQYLPVKFAKDGTPTGDSLADLAQLGVLSRHIDETLLEMGRELQSGGISADPYYRGEQDNACLWCDYFEACHFKEGREGDKRRYLTKLKPGEAWEKMCGGDKA